MPKDKPILIDLEYVHPCFCIEAAEKIEGAKIRGLSLHVRDSKTEEGLFELEAPDVDGLVKFLSRGPHTKSIRVLQKTKTWALANIVFKHEALIASKIMKTKSIPLLPSLTKVDRDFLTVAVPSEKELKQLSSLLKDETEFWVRSKKYLEGPITSSLFSSKDFLKFKLVTDHLPQKQREAFVLATNKGYYEIPKKITVEELAAAAGVSPSTFAEHLRKAEARLLMYLGGMLGKIA